MSTVQETGISTSQEDRDLAERAIIAFSQSEERDLFLGFGRKSNSVVPLPKGLSDSIIESLKRIASGKRPLFATDDEELTTQQAAVYMHVSRPYLVKLLKEGQIPFRMVGSHHRVKKCDLQNFLRRQSVALEQSLSELAALGEEIGG